MKDKAGVWIDHRKAVIVVVTSTGEHTALIVSKVEKHLERSGDSPLKGPYESRQVPADDSRQRALTGELNIYYNAVIAALRTAESLIIFGPGEAKGELKKRLVKNKLGGRVAAVETVDKMTDRQIAAKVREYFSAVWAAKGPKFGRANAGLQGKSPGNAPARLHKDREQAVDQRRPAQRHRNRAAYSEPRVTSPALRASKAPM